METNLPPELREIESALAAQPLPEAGSAARGKILAAVGAELALKARARQQSWWRFAAALAALVLLWLNLSMSAVNCTEIRFSPEEKDGDERAALAQIQDLIPDCTVKEAQRQLLLLRARTRLVSAPPLPHGRLERAEEL
ncbi:MAG: hypothetical protein ABSE73_17000 [Planctomycetota bacterium]